MFQIEICIFRNFGIVFLCKKKNAYETSETKRNLGRTVDKAWAVGDNFEYFINNNDFFGALYLELTIFSTKINFC